MASSLWRVFLCGVLLTTCVGFDAAAGAPPAVQDPAGFFTPEVVQKASAEILALQREFKLELAVDTVAGVPAEKTKQVQEMKPAERNQFFSDWALDRAKAAGVRGVYVLICRVPSHLQVEVGRQTQKRDFTLANRDKIRDVLLAGFKAKEFDKALLDGVAFFHETLQKNVPPEQRALVPGEVKDYAGFFSAGAVEKANADLKSFPREPGKQVAVVTYATPPQARRQEVEKMTAAERSRFFKSWADELGRDGNLDGVLVLICKQPGHALVSFHGAVAEKLFTRSEINRLDNALLSGMRSREYDHGLTDTIRQLRDKLAPAASVAANPASVPPAKTPEAAPVTEPKPAPAGGAVTASVPPPARAPASEPSIDSKPASAASGATTPIMPAKTSPAGPSAENKPMSVMTATTAKSETGQAPAKSESTRPEADAATKAKETLAKVQEKVTEKATEVTEKATEVGKTRYPTWMWAAGIVVGLLALWILRAILRALFGGGPQAPPPQVVTQRPMSDGIPGNVGNPTAAAGGNYVRPPQGAYPPSQGNYPPPPQGGYPTTPQDGYPGPAGPAPQRAGGGFVSSALGGVVGGAAGAWAYDAMRHSGGTAAPGGGGPAAVPHSPTHQPAAADSTGVAQNAPGESGYAAGGDFDASSTGAAGGDFDGAVASTGGGGDFDTSNAADTGGGGDFDNPAPVQESAAGGGDFESPDTRALADDNAGGGDFGGEPVAQDDSPAGGSFDAPADFDQAGSGDAGGGDFGGGDVAAGGDSGGDFA